jgi:hypothetical protein
MIVHVRGSRRAPAIVVKISAPAHNAGCAAGNSPR